MSRRIRLIATDLDGTLLHSDGTIPPRNVAAIQAARDAGMHLVICTGRRHSYAMRVLRQAPMQPDDMVISSNGVVTRTFAGDLLWRSTLSTGCARDLCQLLDEYRNALVLTFDRSAPDGGDAPGALAVQELDTLHRSIRRWMEVNASSIQRFTQIEHALGESGAAAEEPIQAMLCGGLQRMSRADMLLREQFGQHVETFRTEYPGSDLCILDVVPRGTSKGQALRRAAEHLGVPPAEVLAVGDNWNDVPMLDFAGQSVLLANAPQELRQSALRHGWHVGEQADASGFAQALEQIAGLAVSAAASLPEPVAQPV